MCKREFKIINFLIFFIFFASTSITLATTAESPAPNACLYCVNEHVCNILKNRTKPSDTELKARKVKEQAVAVKNSENHT